MTRAEETARVRELRADLHHIAETVNRYADIRDTSDPDSPLMLVLAIANAALAAPQSAAEPAREREPDPLLAAFAPWDDDAWSQVAETETRNG